MVIRFSALFVTMALLFTLLSWGQVSQDHEEDTADHMATEQSWFEEQGGFLGLVSHAALHLLVGGLVASPSRRPNIILASGLAALLIDVDHIGWLGVPTVFRASHSLGFMVVIATVMGFLTRRGFLGRDVPFLLVGAVATSVVPAHILVDYILTKPGFPLWAPFSFAPLELTSFSAAGLLLAAFLLVLVASAKQGMHGRYLA